MPGRHPATCSEAFRGSDTHPRTPAASRSLARSTCVCLCAEWGRGRCRRRGGVRATSRAVPPNQRRTRGPGAGIGAARGQFSITRSPGASGEERSRAGGRRPLRRLGPGTGCRARGPSRLLRSPVALFPPPLRAGLLARGSRGGCSGIAAAGRAAARPRRDSRGTQESGRREGRVRDRGGSESFAAQGCGPGATVSRDLPVEGGRCSPRPWALRAAGASRR